MERGQWLPVAVIGATASKIFTYLVGLIQSHIYLNYLSESVYLVVSILYIY